MIPQDTVTISRQGLRSLMVAGRFAQLLIARMGLEQRLEQEGLAARELPTAVVEAERVLGVPHLETLP